MQYRISYTVFVVNADGRERVPRTGWLTLNAVSDEEAQRHGQWNDDGLLDVDFIAPGDHFPSASNRNVIGGEPPDLKDDEEFWGAVVTKIERLEPLYVGN